MATMGEKPLWAKVFSACRDCAGEAISNSP
jgi:hypothetical protein